MHTVMNTSAEAQSMLDFIKANVVSDSTVPVSENTALVSTGLLDSFALLEVLQHLERVTNRKIRPSDVTPYDLETVAEMLKTAERVGRKR